MKTLKKLAEEIQERPSDYRELLGSYQTNNEELKKFLNSMMAFDRFTVVTIPALILTFGKEFPEFYEPKTLGILSKVAPIGTTFSTIDGEEYFLAGREVNGFVQVKEFNTGLVMDLSVNQEIKWVF